MRRGFLHLALGFALVVAGCSAGADPEVAPPEPEPATVNLPSQLLGLRVQPETIETQLEGIQRSYLDSLGLFSFRDDEDLLRATLQVGRFNDIAENERRRFRNAIIGQLGSAVPREVRLGDESVWITTGNEQNIFVWFSPEGFYVLSVRGDYEFPRTMLRRLVETDILR